MNIKGLRYGTNGAKTWAERDEKLLADLEDMRSHRGYAAMMDFLEADLRAAWRSFLDPDIDGPAALKFRAEALIIKEFIKTIDGKTREKSVQEEEGRIWEGHAADAEMMSAHQSQHSNPSS